MMSPSPLSEKSRETWCIKQKYQHDILFSLLYVCLNLTYQKIPPPTPTTTLANMHRNKSIMGVKGRSTVIQSHVCRKKLI